MVPTNKMTSHELTVPAPVATAGGWIDLEFARTPTDTPFKTGGCPNIDGKKYQKWDCLFVRDERGNVIVEYSLAIDPIARSRAEAKAHQRTRVERVRARLLKRLEAKAGSA